MTVTVRPASENHQHFSGLWKFEQGQVSFAVPRLGPALGWDSKRLDRATARLVELGHLERSPSAPKEHGAYRWPDRTAT
jgi:hypothetical protein